MKPLSGLVLALLLAACAAQKPIYRITDKNEGLPERGVAFSLPRTRIAPSYLLNVHRFEAGPWTAILQTCEDTKPRSAACERMLALALTSKRLSRHPQLGKPSIVCDPPKQVDGEKYPDYVNRLAQTPKDGDTTEVRQSIATKDVTLALTPVPDPEATFWMPLESGFWRSFRSDLSLTPSGVVTSGHAKVTSELAQTAFDLAALTIRASAPPVAVALVAGPAVPKTPGWLSDLADLERLYSARRQFVKGPSSTDATATLEVLEREIAILRARFEGELSVTTLPLSGEAFIPALTCAARRVAVYSACGDKVEATTGIGARKYSEEKKIWEGDPVVPEKMVPRALRAAWVIAEKHPDHAVLDARLTFAGKLACTDMNQECENGWPYRVPAEASLFTAVNDQVATKDDSCRESSFPARRLQAIVLLPQFGHLAYLPKASGGRSSEITVKYHPETGALQQVVVDTQSMSTAKAAQEVATRMTADPEREALRQQSADAQAMATICDKYVGLNLPKPDFCR